MTDHIRPLDHLAGRMPERPAWFENALAVTPEEASVSVDGVSIAYSAWGERGRLGLLFIHGGRAHRRWWYPFMPYFADHFRVAVLDLSGLGDSGWRARYSLKTHADEAFAVCEAAGLMEKGRPLMIGHSFGGYVTLSAVELAGERLRGAVVIDSPFGVPDPDEGYSLSLGGSAPAKPEVAASANRIYETLEEPIRRFRFLPNQPATELYLVDYIAREGLKPVTDPKTGKPGWSWKFDPQHGKNFDIHFNRDLFLAARCPLAFLYGARSALARGDGFDHLRQQARGRSPFIVMPEAHHHLMIDFPMGFVTAMRALLTCWPIRVGH